MVPTVPGCFVDMTVLRIPAVGSSGWAVPRCCDVQPSDTGCENDCVVLQPVLSAAILVHLNVIDAKI